MSQETSPSTTTTRVKAGVNDVVEVYTIQMARWRVLKNTGIEIIDITLKSGDRRFAPDSQLFNDYRYNGLSDQDYKDRFTNLMRQRYRQDPYLFDELLGRDKIALACFCGGDKPCHRYLVEDMMSKVAKSRNINYEYKGEFP